MGRENIDFFFHTDELNNPFSGCIKVKYPNFSGVKPENKQGQDGIVRGGTVTFNDDEKPLPIIFLKLGKRALFNKGFIWSKHPPSIPRITVLVKIYHQF